jgi:hypothetical protein
MHHQPAVQWNDVRKRLHEYPDELRPLGEMERTGGEPDVVACN